MRLKVYHSTTYALTQAATRSVQYLRLTPRMDRSQRTESWHIEGADHLQAWTDGYGNTVHIASESNNHDSVEINVTGLISTFDTNGILPLDDGLPSGMFIKETELTKVSDDIKAFATPFIKLRETKGDVAALHAMMEDQANVIQFEAGHTTVLTTAASAFEKGKGVCQDHTHIFIAACRVIGLPCRYVSGYLALGVGDVATHAWAETFVKELGWVSFDAANRQSATDAYIRLAIGPDYSAVAPIIGIRTGGHGEEISVKVDIQHVQ